MYNEVCKVIQNKELTKGVFEMLLESQNIAKAAAPGQFIHIKVNDSGYPLLRRPISIHFVDPAAGITAIVYHAVGQGTEMLSQVKAGDQLDVMGPLGHGFPFFEGKRCAVVGGGMGTAPLLELARNISDCDGYLGFRDCVYKLEDFEQSCKAVFVTTEDGSVGHKGYITEQLEKRISEYDVVYTCGPKPMMQKVMDICNRNHVECYVSIEERMGCGIGACLVCACKIQGEDGTWHHKKACKDGPVFNAKEVLLDA